VLSENKKKDMKQLLAEIFELKTQYINQLIEGYESLDEVYRTLLTIMRRADSLDRYFKRELETSKENMHYLKL
jgi:hypothetical protein